MEKPFFSVIIPTLNEEEFIGRLLTDLVNQKDKDFEVIVVDGKSSDKTCLVAAKFAHKFSAFQIINSYQQGVSRQRNLGSRKAYGKYLVFFDADLQIPPRFLKLVKSQIMGHGGFVFTTYIRPDSRNPYDEVISKFINRGMVLSLLLDRPFVGGYSFFVEKKAFVSVGGFREDVVYAEDYDLSMRLNRAGYEVKYLRKPKAVFSLRRFRKTGRLAFIRYNARAGLHIFTKGAITGQLFKYPMGGGWYRSFSKKHPGSELVARAEKYMKRFAQIFLE